MFLFYCSSIYDSRVDSRISFFPNDKCSDSYISYLECLSPVEVIRFDYDLFLGRFAVSFDFRSGHLDVWCTLYLQLDEKCSTEFTIE